MAEIFAGQNFHGAEIFAGRKFSRVLLGNMSYIIPWHALGLQVINYTSHCIGQTHKLTACTTLQDTYWHVKLRSCRKGFVTSYGHTRVVNWGRHHGPRIAQKWPKVSPEGEGTTLALERVVWQEDEERATGVMPPPLLVLMSHETPTPRRTGE